MGKFIKILLTNTVIFFLILGSIELICRVIVKNRLQDNMNAITVPVPVGDQFHKYLKTTEKEKYTYRAFVGWVHDDWKSDTVNVQNGIRYTPQAINEPNAQRVYFYGGSTVWGTYVSDQNTIPSLYAKLDSDKKVINYGEQSYNSSQELNRLIQNYNNLRENDAVIFYDGVNDTFNGCKNGALSHSRERTINELLKMPDHSALNNFTESLKNVSYHFYIKIIDIVKRRYIYKIIENSKYVRLETEGFKRVPLKELADCKNAGDIAENLVRNWTVAENLLKYKKVRFHCLLQPNPYTFNPPSNGRLEWKNWVEKVYPLIIMEAKNLECFKNLENSLNEYYYVDDCCHLNADGNKAMASKIYQTIKQN